MRALLLAAVLAAALVVSACGASAPTDDEPDARAQDGGGTSLGATPSTPATPDVSPGPGGDEGLGNVAPATLPTTVPTSAADVAARITTAGSAHDPVDLGRFVTPSGNIYCSEIGDRPGCELGEGRMTDATTCAGAPIRSVGRVELVGGRAVLVCNTDTIRAPGARTLPYDRVASTGTGGVSCLSQRVGVSCLDLSSGAAFFLRRGEVRSFG